MIDEQFTDPRSPSTARFDALVDQVADSTRTVAALSAAVRELVSSPHNTQTIIHKSGAGGLLGAAIAMCFATWLGLILFALYAIPELHDLRAWQDINKAHINALEARGEKK